MRQHLHSLWDQMIADYQASEYVVLRRGEKVAWEQVQHWLHSRPKHVALVAFYMLIEQVVVFVVREGDVEPAVICLNVSQEDMLAYVMRCWREVYEFDEQEPLRETWQAIGKHEGETPLLDQLMPHLLGAELVYLIPHGLPHLLPLHALTYENKPLIMHAPIAYLPSVAIALRMRQRQTALSVLKQEDVLVLGNPTGDLPDAEEEAGIIVHRFGIRPLAPADATKERVRAAFQHKQLIHLATHAAFNDIDPFASGIMLAPDWQNSTSNVKRMLNNQERDITILTAYEVLEAQLLANLVVLSACETGRLSVDAGDEQDGFARAFLYAGVPSLLLSKWSVDSEKTRALMLDFYDHLYDAEGRQRVSIAEASQTAMIAGYEKWQFTYYWAPFILFGNWQ